MQLKEFSLISPVVESGAVLKALETAIPSAAIEQAISDTQSDEKRKRALPSHLVVPAQASFLLNSGSLMGIANTSAHTAGGCWIENDAT